MTELLSKINLEPVLEEESGLRLDLFLSKRCEDLSRSRIQQLLKEGHVIKENSDLKLTAKTAVRSGDQFSIHVPEAEDLDIIAENIPLEILYEDNDLIVINKPAGMVVHPAPGHSKGTLVNALLGHCAESLSGIGGIKRPGIVHRLDKDTSGLIVIAKNDDAHHKLSAQFSKRDLSRVYYALVWGVPSPQIGQIETQMGRHKTDRMRMAVLKSGGKEAITDYEVVKNFKNQASLIECHLQTGRTHQIRVHMSHIGTPLVGDPTYNANRRPLTVPIAAITKILNAFPRQALHAAELHFIHPSTKEDMSFESELPEDFRQLLDDLSNACKANI
ncbi:MAG: RluA family pseudouridine synthase [Alphaproteobacteria bacterium]|jgi:23S rRNA pseudouridine1911/1915/1917 synthase|nr:RluA family pseudouridine synthase [Alphaproteobacteria bacterium]MBP9876950.1 RluA family pseudouridine synthase [Alphaproteobacteria bacterium]